MLSRFMVMGPDQEYGLFDVTYFFEFFETESKILEHAKLLTYSQMAWRILLNFELL